MEAQGIKPKIGMFGRNAYELIERFARYLDDTQKDIVYVLSCLGQWRDQEFYDIVSSVLPGFSITTYEKVKALSFIAQSDDGDISIH